MHAHPFGKIKVNNASADRQEERERDVCVCVGVFFLNFVVSFTQGTRLYISEFSVVLFKKSIFTRCLAVSILK